ncbi:MAG TPA: hypothetical protein VGS80_13880 [Ktedonobacterales bacterium]|jgi:hypothetical protein|nr:hypothetical protein [Ktedonobacterales bacterium]
MRFILRFIATIFGIIGFVIGLLVDLGNSALHAVGVNSTQTHGFIGFFLVLIGLIGAFIAVPLPLAAAVLMLIACVGSFFIVGPVAIVAGIFFIIGAALAFFDRTRAKAAMQRA